MVKSIDDINRNLRLSVGYAVIDSILVQNEAFLGRLGEAVEELDEAAIGKLILSVYFPKEAA